LIPFQEFDDMRLTLLRCAVLGSTLCLAWIATAQPTSPKTPPTSACPTTISGISDCPEAGCGENGDVELNKAKNRTDIPKAADVKHKTLASMRALSQPTRWDTGQDRASIRTAGKEGTPVELMGYLLLVKPGSGESCNCELSRRVDTDVHMVLVGDAETDGEETSVTVEITPRVRANGHPDWLFKNVKNELEGQFIKVTGWVMLDTKHIRQTHRLTGERANKGLVRATNWEVHPVTKLEVCQKSVSACKSGDGWQEFAVP
jgi:hypothetical protein